MLTLFVNATFAQVKDDLYYDGQEKQDSSIIENDAIPHLYKYHQARKMAFATGALSFTIGVVSGLIYEKYPDLAVYGIISAGIVSTISYIMLWSAEVHLKNAALTLTPTGAVMKF